MTTPTTSPDAPIGIFDSGVGGLSVLRHIRAQLPHEHLMYFADSAFAPYGAKTEPVLAERVLAIGGFLVERGAKAIVVACNTATIAAIALLRERYPDMPIVGVEPGLKPAAAASRSRTVGVLATEVTLSGKKFLLLRDQISEATGARFLLQPCHGLVDQIELGELESEATTLLLRKYVEPLLAEGADTLVLGCTHYPLVQASIERVIAAATDRPVTLIDTGDAVARQLTRLLAANASLRPEAVLPARLDGYTSASATALSAAFASLLGLDPPVHEVESGPDGRMLTRQNN
ncbi:glutamate racemase [Massilia sp. Dwa41.01b]|uniref:glutamate racemase n=1 Tax=unclassified Massilia TaxID=2609279 RepID=UPI0016001D99|nr:MULTISPECIES: glutamate racemase [unclassified Massilia]QNA88240.1 glutamate racemase [Massilia sp. Dwa41.01b]QNA99139.1 glutamate racemase [Massilia sp. Se16.2.3]